MKTITIRLPDVEAAMLEELVKSSRETRSIQEWVVAHVRDAYFSLRR